MFTRAGVFAAALAVAGFGIATTAHAGAIVGATSAVINSGGPGFGTLVETFNQAGLSAGYVSGVTNFNTYIASGPTHTLVFAGNEWFSELGSTSASVTYNLGSAVSLDGLALWNEEVSGIGLLDLFYSTDGTNFSSLLSGLVPTNNPTGSDYLADVFSFGSVSAQYIRFDMSNCPQPGGSFASCAIGEVAFRTADVVVTPPNGVPEPGSLALLGLGLAGLAAVRKRKQA